MLHKSEDGTDSTNIDKFQKSLYFLSFHVYLKPKPKTDVNVNMAVNKILENIGEEVNSNWNLDLNKPFVQGMFNGNLQCGQNFTTCTLKSFFGRKVTVLNRTEIKGSSLYDSVKTKKDFEALILNVLKIFKSVRNELLKTVFKYFEACHIELIGGQENFARIYIENYENENLFHALVACYVKIFKSINDKHGAEEEEILNIDYNGNNILQEECDIELDVLIIDTSMNETGAMIFSAITSQAGITSPPCQPVFEEEENNSSSARKKKTAISDAVEVNAAAAAVSAAVVTVVPVTQVNLRLAERRSHPTNAQLKMVMEALEVCNNNNNMVCHIFIGYVNIVLVMVSNMAS